LTRLKAGIEAALRSGDPVQHREALVRTLDESDRLLQTFNALLSIAKAEAGQSREGLHEMDLKPVLEDVAELYEPMIEEKGGVLETAIEEGLMARADRQLLAQAVSNLIDNAMKYGATGENPVPAIRLEGRRGGTDVKISVADRGPGIPEGDRERVVQRFVRLDSSRSQPGNGLGLSLVSGVMTLHGGKLLLEDNAPGLRAVLVLPASVGAR
jgi:signal transduction histidine kinase